MKRNRLLVVISVLLSLTLVLGACERPDADPGADQTPVAAQIQDPSDAPASPDRAGAPADEGQVDPESASAEASPAGQSDAQTTPGLPAVSGTIVLWHSWAGTEGDALAQIIQTYQAQYPGVQVDTLFVAHDDLLQSYAEAVLAEGGPTLLLAPNWWLEEMVLLQLLAPFGPELAQSTTDALFPAALESMVWQDIVYGVPVHVTVPAVYVNTSLYNGPFPQSLADWYDLAAQDTQYGLGLYANLYHLAWGLSAHDAALFDGQGRVVLDANRGAVEFLTWLRASSQLDGTFVDQDYGMLLDRYKKGEFAFFVDGPWSLSELETVFGEDLSVQPLPAGPSSSAMPWLYAEGLFLNPNTDEATRRMAVTFAQHLAGPHAAEILTSSRSLLPANRMLTLPAENRLAGFHAQAHSAVAMPTRREMDTVWGYGGDMLIRALLGYPDLSGDELTAAYIELVAETTTLINEANGR